MLIHRIHRIGPSRIRRRRQYISVGASLDDVGRVTAARTLGVIGMNRATSKSRKRVFDKS